MGKRRDRQKWVKTGKRSRKLNREMEPKVGAKAGVPELNKAAGGEGQDQGIGRKIGKDSGKVSGKGVFEKDQPRAVRTSTNRRRLLEASQNTRNTRNTRQNMQPSSLRPPPKAPGPLSPVA